MNNEIMKEFQKKLNEGSCCYVIKEYQREYLKEEDVLCSVAFEYEGEEFENVEEIAELMNILRPKIKDIFGGDSADFCYGRGVFEFRKFSADGKSECLISFKDMDELGAWLVSNNTGVKLRWFREVGAIVENAPAFLTKEACERYISIHYDEGESVFPVRMDVDEKLERALEVIRTTDWEKSTLVGRLPELEEIRQRLEAKVEELFGEIQTEAGIRSGDIEPLSQLRLDEIEDTLSELVLDVLQFQID